LLSCIVKEAGGVEVAELLEPHQSFSQPHTKIASSQHSMSSLGSNWNSNYLFSILYTFCKAKLNYYLLLTADFLHKV
jgi:hypothetical protein